MGLIMYGGNAKSDAMEAIAAAKEGNFELADQKIADAEASLVEAHHSQTGLLTQEAQGNHMTVTLLTVHSARPSNDINRIYRSSERNH